jgi:tRNA(Ile)-lysidine synthase
VTHASGSLGVETNWPEAVGEGKIAVAFSGGLDSTALLHWLSTTARLNGPRVVAVHVDVQMQGVSASAAPYCRKQCEAIKVPLDVYSAVAVESGNGLEAAAREARYSVFRQLPYRVIALAHTAEDRVETVLHRLVRGAGVKGLAAMRQTAFLGVTNSSPKILWRPLLVVSRAALLDYARYHSLTWLRDADNFAPRFKRNQIRYGVVPRIESIAPGFRKPVIRTAQALDEADDLLAQIADADLAGLGGDQTKVELRRLSELSAARARNALRRWITAQGHLPPSARKLAELIRQLVNAESNKSVAVEMGGICVRRFRGHLYLVPVVPVLEYDFSYRWDGGDKIRSPRMSGEILLGLTIGSGLPRRFLREREIRIRNYRPKDGTRLFTDRRAVLVGDLLRKAHVPPWNRRLWPVLICDGEAVSLPGIAVGDHYRAGPGEPSVQCRWRFNVYPVDAQAGP